MSVWDAVAGAAIDWFTKREKKRHEQKISECADKLKRYSDRARHVNRRLRWYRTSDLAQQLGPDSHLVGEVLVFMKERGDVRETPEPGIWELAPYVDGPWRNH
jgi:hypothetical protein